MQFELEVSSAAEQPSKIAYLRANHRTELEFALLVMLENLASSFNVKETFDDSQIDDCILTIIAEFYIIAPEEILYVFRGAKSGKYGPVYNRLDTVTICGWIRTYMNGERAFYFQQKHQQPKREPEVDIMKALGTGMETLKLAEKKPIVISPEEKKKEALRRRLKDQLEERAQRMTQLAEQQKEAEKAID